MRIAILGGTSFIGRAITEHLAGLAHDVLVVHRGRSEPPDLPPVRHLHVERAELPGARAEIEGFAPDAAVEVYAMNGPEARAALEALPEGIRLVAISSCDVYRAYQALHTGHQTDALPIPESAPLREPGFVEPMRGEVSADDRRDENVEVEDAYLARGGTVLRLGAVYGPHDYQRRFEFVLRRLRSGRWRIPIGAGTFLFSRVHVHDVATAVAAALSTDAARGEVFNIVERRTMPYRLFAQQVLDAAVEAAVGAEGGAAADAELVQVPDSALPPDLSITGTISQHLLMDAGKAREVLGWRETDPAEALRASVRWHLDHPPVDWDRNFRADDSALATSPEPPRIREPREDM